MLLSIDHNGPVIVRDLGANGGGIVWTVEPDRFDSVIAMINTHGGPACWSVEPA